jgi:hypothetical protein
MAPPFSLLGYCLRIPLTERTIGQNFTAKCLTAEASCMHELA